MLDQSNLHPHDIVYVDERDAIHQCRRFTRKTGVLIGGSTGSVLAATERYIREHDLSAQVVALISPDLGHSYLSTIYDDRWVREHFPQGDGDESPRQLPIGASDRFLPDRARGADGVQLQLP